MLQIARQITDEFDGALTDVRFLIIDRDTKFTQHFKACLKREDVTPVVCPPRAPNCNRYAERFVRSIKEECLARVVPISVGSLRRAINQYVVHYHRERNHQGLDNQLVERLSQPAHDGVICRHERLGGMLNYDYRKAA